MFKGSHRKSDWTFSSPASNYRATAQAEGLARCSTSKERLITNRKESGCSKDRWRTQFQKEV